MLHEPPDVDEQVKEPDGLLCYSCRQLSSATQASSIGQLDTATTVDKIVELPIPFEHSDSDLSAPPLEKATLVLAKTTKAHIIHAADVKEG